MARGSILPPHIIAFWVILLQPGYDIVSPNVLVGISVDSFFGLKKYGGIFISSDATTPSIMIWAGCLVLHLLATASRLRMVVRSKVRDTDACACICFEFTQSRPTERTLYFTSLPADSDGMGVHVDQSRRVHCSPLPLS